jgi:hypothetical protein
MRHAIAAPIVIVALTAALFAGCGGDDSSGDSTGGTSTTTTNNNGGGGEASVCATYAFVKATGQDVAELNPGDASPSQVKKAVTNLSKSVQAFAAAAADTGGEAKSDVDSAVDTFQSQFNAAQGKPPAEQLTALGNAIDELESSLKQTVNQLKC